MPHFCMSNGQLLLLVVWTDRMLNSWMLNSSTLKMMCSWCIQGYINFDIAIRFIIIQSKFFNIHNCKMLQTWKLRLRWVENNPPPPQLVCTWNCHGSLRCMRCNKGPNIQQQAFVKGRPTPKTTGNASSALGPSASAAACCLENGQWECRPFSETGWTRNPIKNHWNILKPQKSVGAGKNGVMFFASPITWCYNWPIQLLLQHWLVLEMEGIFKFIRPWQPSCLAKAANLRCLAWQQPKSHQRRKVKRTNPVMLNYSNPINQSFIVILIYHGSSWFISHEFVHQNELHFCLTPWYLALRPPRRVGFRRLSGLVTWSLGSCMVVSCCLPCHPPSTKHVGKQQWSSSQFPRIPTKESLNFFVSFQQPACGQIQLCIWGAYF